MAGQLWAVPSEGGYLYSPELSKTMRMQAQALARFRMFCDVEDGSEKEVGSGDLFFWDIVENLATQGWDLDELQPMPETNFTVRQRSLTVTEAGNSVPFTKKLALLAKRDLERIVDNALLRDAVKFFDAKVFLEFKSTPLRVVPASGTSTTAIELSTNGVPAQTNNVAMNTDHVKAISDAMKMRNIPPYVDNDYYAIAHPVTWRPVKNELEDIHKYTDTGLGFIRKGEIGRYEDIRFIEQNNIPLGGAADSTTFSARNGVADAWNNALSSWAFFFGNDTVMEAVVQPEEVRAKIAGDYGRGRGIAWYWLGGFGLVHPEALHARVVMWDSAA